SRVRAAVPEGPTSRASTILAVLLLVPGLGMVGSWDMALREVSDHDDWIEAWQAIDTEFPANDTAIVASYSWAHTKWFFPDHILWSRLAIPPGPDWDDPWVLTMQTQHREDDVGFYEAHLRGPVPTAHPIPDTIKRVVLFDFQLAGENGGTRTLRPEIEVHESHLESGWRVLWFAPDAEHPTIESCFVDG
ncbi:MAG: hypothetical protein QOJ26_1669, partial [Thermoplasmata archaeon]|nr:hypothetical protein [Thermoplasmata archaeon]